MKKTSLISNIIFAALLAGCNGSADIQNGGNIQLSLSASNLRAININLIDEQTQKSVGEEGNIFPDEDNPAENEQTFKFRVASSAKVLVDMQAITTEGSGEEQGVFLWNAMQDEDTFHEEMRQLEVKLQHEREACGDNRSCIEEVEKRQEEAWMEFEERDRRQSCAVGTGTEQCIIKGQKMYGAYAAPRFVKMTAVADGASEEPLRMLVHTKVMVKTEPAFIKTHFNLDKDGNWAGYLLNGIHLIQVVQGKNDQVLPISHGGKSCNELVLFDYDNTEDEVLRDYKSYLNKDLDMDCAVELYSFNEVKSCVGDCANMCPLMEITVPADNLGDNMVAAVKEIVRDSFGDKVDAESLAAEAFSGVKTTLPAWQNVIDTDLPLSAKPDFSCPLRVTIQNKVPVGTIYSLTSEDLPGYAPGCLYTQDSDLARIFITEPKTYYDLENNLRELTIISPDADGHPRFIALSGNNNVVLLTYGYDGGEQKEKWQVTRIYQSDPDNTMDIFNQKHLFSTGDGQYGFYWQIDIDNYQLDQEDGLVVGYIFGEYPEDAQKMVLRSNDQEGSRPGEITYKFAKSSDYENSIIGVIGSGPSGIGESYPRLLIINNPRAKLFVYGKNQIDKEYEDMEIVTESYIRRVSGNLGDFTMQVTNKSWDVITCKESGCKFVTADPYRDYLVMDNNDGMAIDGNSFGYAGSYWGQGIYKTTAAVDNIGGQDAMEFTELAAFPVLGEVSSVAVDNEGNIYYIGGTMADKLYRLNKDDLANPQLLAWTERSSLADVNLFPGALAYDYDGHLLVGLSEIGEVVPLDIRSGARLEDRRVGNYVGGRGLFTDNAQNLRERHLGSILDIKVDSVSKNYFVAASLGKNHTNESWQYNSDSQCELWQVYGSGIEEEYKMDCRNWLDRGVIYGVTAGDEPQVRLLAGKQVRGSGKIGDYYWEEECSLLDYAINFASDTDNHKSLALLNGAAYFDEAARETDTDGQGRIRGTDGKKNNIEFVLFAQVYNKNSYFGPNVTVKDKNGHQILFLGENGYVEETNGDYGYKELVNKSALVCRDMDNAEAPTYSFGGFGSVLTDILGMAMENGAAGVGEVSLVAGSSYDGVDNGAVAENVAIAGLTGDGQDTIYALLQFDNQYHIVGFRFANGFDCSVSDNNTVQMFLVAPMLHGLAIDAAYGLAYVPADPQSAYPDLLCFGDQSFGQVRCITSISTLNRCQTEWMALRENCYSAQSSAGAAAATATDCTLYPTCREYFDGIQTIILQGSGDLSSDDGAETVFDLNAYCPPPSPKWGRIEH